MATIEKRLQVTPTTRTRLVLERYSKVTGKPMSRLVSELMDESTPILVDMLDTIEKARQRPSVARSAVQKYINEAQGTIDAVQQELDGLFKKRPGRKPKAKGR